jgi:hypothetical protein
VGGDDAEDADDAHGGEHFAAARGDIDDGDSDDADDENADNQDAPDDNDGEEDNNFDFHEGDDDHLDVGSPGGPTVAELCRRFLVWRQSR